MTNKKNYRIGVDVTLDVIEENGNPVFLFRDKNITIRPDVTIYYRNFSQGINSTITRTRE